MYKDLFIARLTILRMKKGVSSQEMSFALGKHRNYISKIEHKQAFPSVESFFQICIYLAVTPQEFFTENKLKPDLFKDAVAEMENLEHDDLMLTYLCIRRLLQDRKARVG